MPRAYSTDLRMRVIAAMQAGATCRAVAAGTRTGSDVPSKNASAPASRRRRPCSVTSRCSDGDILSLPEKYRWPNVMASRS